MNSTQYRYNERIDPTAIEQHDRLAMRIWKLVFAGAVGLFLAVWMVYLTDTGAITTANDWWVPLGLAGWFMFIVCGVGAIMFLMMIKNLPEVQVARSRETVVEQDAQPAQITIVERIRGNNMTRSILEWDMSEEEQIDFVNAIRAAGWRATRQVILDDKKIKNVHQRYGDWMLALEKVDGAERVGNRWELTQDGEIILQRLVPPAPNGQ